MGAPPRDSSHDEVLRSRTGSQHPSLMWEPPALALPCPDTHSQGPVLGRWLSVGVGGKGLCGYMDPARPIPLVGRGPGGSPWGGALGVAPRG